MKALSLWQPWASFITIGVKPYETRHWSPPVRLIGQRIAIHAAKQRVNEDDCDWARRCGIANLPLGAIVCTAILAGAYQCGRHVEGMARIMRAVPGSIYNGAALGVDEFGDYAPDRWAWLLTDVRALAEPIPYRGAQGIFEVPCTLFEVRAA